MADLTPHDIGWFESADELRDWLAEHHASAPEKWVGMRPKAAGVPTVTWEEIVDEVLCVGWIDGIRKKADGGSVIRITPRRTGSVWSARNVGRVEALRAAGRMRPAGEAEFARRREDRTAIYSFDGSWALDTLAEARLRADADGWAYWEALPKGYRRIATQWVMSAKRQETRERRLAQVAEACAAGRRLPQLTGSARPPDAD
jgi:uncharacterized protein YdeI (YjbR/CyaY-like superfamily)